MPTLDVNDAFDPSFLDIILVDRITQVIDQYGRVHRTKRRYQVNAVVTATGPDDLQRIPEYEMMNKSISVYCPDFRLQGPVRPNAGTVAQLNQTQPDEIIWHDSTFVVHSAQDYSGYGRGFTSAIAISIDSVDAPPLGGSAGVA
jgi:hypothetical protein